jgi:hypothetical protein
MPRRLVFPSVLIVVLVAATSVVPAQSPSATPATPAPASAASVAADLGPTSPTPSNTPASAAPPDTHAPAVPEPTTTKGFSYATSFTGDHDSTTGWSTVMDSSVSYDFNRIFGVTLGMPLYLSHNGYNSDVVVRGNKVPPLITTYNALGDLYLDLKLSAPDSWVGYQATLAGTAPTGDTSSGISTGRPTFDLNNHMEHAWGFFTPLAEFGFGDSSALVNRRVRRPYTTLGPLSHFKAGADFAFLKAFDFQVAGYEDLPVGNQKVYSHLFRKLKTPIVLAGGRVKRYRLLRVDTGDGILEDNGLSNTMTISLGKHVDLSGIYQRSLRQSLDTVQFGIGFHFGRSSGKTSL